MADWMVTARAERYVACFYRGMPKSVGHEAELQRRAVVFQPPDALLPEQHQPFAVQVEVDQSEVRA